MPEFENRTALVTGAATGNGEAIARRLFGGGARVVLAGHDRDAMQSLARSLDPTGERTRVAEGDVRDPSFMPRAVACATQTWGGLHLAVNNAGITGPGDTRLEDLALQDWQAVIDTDLTGMFLSLKAELPAIVRAGGGAIVNLSSANGVVGVAGLAAYTTAKHGVIGLTRSAALEYAERKVRINCIGPGYVATPRMLQMPQDALDMLAAQHPLGRLAGTEEVAELCAFLLSDRAAFCTGAFYPLDGGYTAR